VDVDYVVENGFQDFFLERAIFLKNFPFAFLLICCNNRKDTSNNLRERVEEKLFVQLAFNRQLGFYVEISSV
jgi:hypothetical protein